MTRLRSFFSRIRALFRRQELDERIDEELHFHVEMETAENIHRGMSEHETRRQALMDSGGVEQVKEAHRDVRGVPFLESLIQDIRFALRSFRRDPGFTATVLVTLALGIGVGTAIFAVVNAVLLQPLPYEEPDRLVTLWRVNEQEGGDVEYRLRRTPLSPADFYDWRDQSGLFDSAVAVVASATSFDNHAQINSGQYVDEGFCPTLGVQPLLGRCFLPDDVRPEPPFTYILQYDFWKRDFGGDPGVVGRTYDEISGRQGTIIGVMPPGFVLVSRSTNWLHGRSFIARKANRSTFNLRPIARLKAGLTLEQAQAGADVFSRRLAESYPDIHAGWRVVLIPVAEEAAGQLHGPLFLLLMASSLVLLIVCLNISGLVLVRSLARSTELAVRSAIGAGRSRLIRQLVTENVVLSIVGGAIGLGSAYFLVDYLRYWIPSTGGADGVLRAESIRVDPWVITFAVGVALASGILFGLLPAFRGTSGCLAAWIKEGSNSALGGMRAQRARHWLSVAQVSLAVVLTVGACLLVRSFLQLHQRGPGFRPEGVVALPINASHLIFRVRSEGLVGEDRLRYYERYWQSLSEGLQGIPGVSAVTSTGLLPMKDRRSPVSYWPEGHDKVQAEPIFALRTWADIGYLRMLGIPLMEGRFFNRRDRLGSTQVVMINEEAARRFWPGESPLGKTIVDDRKQDPDAAGMTVVGVVGDVRTNGLRQAPQPMVYEAALQVRGRQGWLLIKSARSAVSLLPDIVGRLRAVDPDLRTYAQQYYRFDHLVRDSIWRLNYSMLLLVGLAGLALLVSSVGIYGVLSYTVRQRTREIGLRLALGADRSHVMNTILRQGISVAIAGVVIGGAAAAALSRYLSSLVHEVQPLDWLTLVFVSGIMLAAALLASYQPAAKAARMDPMTALRHE